MRSLSRLVVVILVIGALAGLVYAGTSNLVYTAAQSTAIQTLLIPMYNADHCQQRGLAANCTSANLVTAGCSVASATFKTIIQDSCTIFTSDVSGEALFLKEVANIGLVSTYNRLIAKDNAAYQAAECSRFKALSVGNQNTECTLRGLPSGCAGPCP
jgi:hypothetical protein